MASEYGFQLKELTISSISATVDSNKEESPQLAISYKVELWPPSDPASLSAALEINSHIYDPNGRVIIECQAKAILEFATSPDDWVEAVKGIYRECVQTEIINRARMILEVMGYPIVPVADSPKEP